MSCQVWASRVGGAGGKRPAGKVAVDGSPMGAKMQAGVCPEEVSVPFGKADRRPHLCTISKASYFVCSYEVLSFPSYE